MIFGSASCKSKVRLVGRTFVITGANTGIGKETARDLYRRGARVILACRNLVKARAAVEELKTTPPSNPDREQFTGGAGELEICQLDLNSLASVRECAKQISSSESAVHGLINNAGIMMCPKATTEDGFEAQIGCNHLGHFLLTILLLPKIIASRNETGNGPCCRIVTVSSIVHRGGIIDFDDLMSSRSYSPWKAYQQSKLANVLFTKELARRLEDSNITGIHAYSLHPGVIATELGRHFSATMFCGASMMFGTMAKPFLKSPEQGAQTTIYCAVDETAANETGLYYRECQVTKPDAAALDEGTAARLWDESVKLVGLEKCDNLTELLDHVSKDQK